MPWGVCLHFKTSIRQRKPGYLFHPCLDPHFEFDTEFDKTPILRHFHHFQHHQKSPHITQKSHQTLENKAFPRTQPKISYLTTK